MKQNYRRKQRSLCRTVQQISVIYCWRAEKQHAKGKHQRNTVGQKDQWVSNQRAIGAKERGRSDKIYARKGNRDLQWKIESLKYLLGSLSPSQPHHCLLPAFVSILDSPVHLEIWCWFKSVFSKEVKRMTRSVVYQSYTYLSQWY